MLLQIKGDITYNGEDFSQFIPERTAAYVNQVRCLSKRGFARLQHQHALTINNVQEVHINP